VGVRGEANRHTSAVRQQFVADLVGGVDGSVPFQTQKQLADILWSYEDVFSQSDTDFRHTTIVSHSIDTGDARPIRQRLRRFPPAHVEAILLWQEVVEPASSP